MARTQLYKPNLSGFGHEHMGEHTNENLALSTRQRTSYAE